MAAFDKSDLRARLVERDGLVVVTMTEGVDSNADEDERIVDMSKPQCGSKELPLNSPCLPAARGGDMEEGISLG